MQRQLQELHGKSMFGRRGDGVSPLDSVEAAVDVRNGSDRCLLRGGVLRLRLYEDLGTRLDGGSARTKGKVRTLIGS